jgi:hypothetical protein
MYIKHQFITLNYNEQKAKPHYSVFSLNPLLHFTQIFDHVVGTSKQLDLLQHKHRLHNNADCSPQYESAVSVGPNFCQSYQDALLIYLLERQMGFYLLAVVRQ